MHVAEFASVDVTDANTAILVVIGGETRSFSEQGQVDPHHLMFVPSHVQRVRDVAPAAVRELDDAVERQHAAVYRDHPFLEPADQVGWLRRLLDSDQVRGVLQLD